MSTKEFPEIIYHYTSNDALIKILKEKSLRMSARHHLNDTMEGEQFFAVLKTHTSLPTEEEINKIKREFDRLECYVTCFCSNGDLLSQWRGYAGNGTGVSVGFKTQAIVDIIKGGHEAILYAVAYANNYNELTASYKKRASTINDILQSETIPARKQAIHSFAKERWAIKPSGFYEEMEYRLILTAECEEGQVKPKTAGFDIEYIATASEVREFCKFSFEKIDHLIESITLGPNNRTDEAVIKRFLTSVGLEHVKVKRTAISYR